MTSQHETCGEPDCEQCSRLDTPPQAKHERICWACHAVYVGELGASGKCPNCERGVPSDPPLDVMSEPRLPSSNQCLYCGRENGEHNEVCVYADNVRVRAERDDALEVLAMALPAPRPWPTESIPAKLRIYREIAKDRLRPADETKPQPENFAWVPWHPKKGFELESITDREEDRLTLANGWQWLPVYAGSAQETSVTPNECQNLRCRQTGKCVGTLPCTRVHPPGGFGENGGTDGG